jgi:hypothetical protein
MIEIKALGAQGDVVFRRVLAIPANAVAQTANGPIIVAHSETGHHHAIHDAGVHLFEDPERDAMVRFLAVTGEFADVVHHRSYDTHETLRLPHGLWEVRRQQQWMPDGRQLVAD